MKFTQNLQHNGKAVNSLNILVKYLVNMHYTMVQSEQEKVESVD